MLCTRKFAFDCAHKVLEHESKCKYMHGHRFYAEVTCWAPSLNKLGMVMDFGDIKKLVGSWIDSEWDHNCLLNSEDPLAKMCSKEGAGMSQGGTFELGPTTEELFGRRPFILPKRNPTAEVLAEVLFHKSVELLSSTPVKVTNVRMYETPNNWSDFRNPFFHAMD